jgi:hypothetical protein
LVGCSTGGIGSCCAKGCVAGLPVKVAHIVGSGGGAVLVGGGGTNALAALFLDVRTVTAPAAAPIFNALLLLMPLFLPGIGFFASSFGLAIDALLFFKLHLNAVPEAATVYITRLKSESI